MYQQVAEGSEGYIEVLIEANEIVACLETRLKMNLNIPANHN